MTCGIAVKRPLDFDSYLSPDSSIEPKRSRQANPQCSPFRPQLGTLATSLSTTQQFNKNNKTSEHGALFDQISNKCQLSSNQLDTYLRAEVQYLKRRKLIPRRNIGIGQTQNENKTGETYASGASSPSTNGSDSDNDTTMSTSNYETNNASLIENLYEKPHFSLRQVKLIFERLLKEQEQRLRYEYETLLNKKLEEKHEQFIQFAKEHLEKHSTDRECSYYS